MRINVQLLIGAVAIGPLIVSASAQQSGVRPSPRSNHPTHPAVDTGTINGAAYQIDFPDNWNGNVVVFAHGYDDRPLAPLGPTPFPQSL